MLNVFEVIRENDKIEESKIVFSTRDLLTDDEALIDTAMNLWPESLADETFESFGYYVMPCEVHGNKMVCNSFNLTEDGCEWKTFFKASLIDRDIEYVYASGRCVTEGLARDEAQIAFIDALKLLQED